MKRIFAFWLILALFVLPPVMANDTPATVGGLAIGWTSDYFNAEPIRNAWERVRLEFSPVITVSDKTWLLPQIDWATTNGLVRVTGALYTHLYTYKSTSLYVGGSVSPLQLATDGVVQINSQGSVAFDIGATWHVCKGVLFGIALRQELSGQVGSEIPEIESPAHVTTLKIGVIGIL